MVLRASSVAQSYYAGVQPEVSLETKLSSFLGLTKTEEYTFQVTKKRCINHQASYENIIL